MAKKSSVSGILPEDTEVRLEQDFLIRFVDTEHGNQVIGTVKPVNRRCWWAPWRKRTVITFEGDIDKSAKLLFELWGRCTDAP